MHALSGVLSGEALGCLCLAVQARARLHKFATLKLLPQPALKLHYELPLLDTGLVASLNYYCPFVEDLRSPIHPPASIMLR